MDRGTDGRTDRPTDRAGCRVACTRLKKDNLSSFSLTDFTGVFRKSHSAFEFLVKSSFSATVIKDNRFIMVAKKDEKNRKRKIINGYCATYQS